MNYYLYLLGAIIGIVVGIPIAHILCQIVDEYFYPSQGSSPVWSWNVAKIKRKLEEEVK